MLIQKYFPANYSDCFSKQIKTIAPVTVDDLFEELFCSYPRPVQWLLRLRDTLVKPFGLKRGVYFRNRIIERNEDEIIIGLDDRHLSFWVAVYCSIPEKGLQTASVTTVVRFNNLLGRLYFAVIWVFHKTIVGHLFRKATLRNNRN